MTFSNQTLSGEQMADFIRIRDTQGPEAARAFRTRALKGDATPAGPGGRVLPLTESEKKAEEARLILRDQLKLLGEAETERLAKSRKEREKDEAAGRKRGAELFSEGALGRVGTAPSDVASQLFADRQASLDALGGQVGAQIAGRDATTAQGVAAFDELIRQRTDPNSELAKLQRSAGREQINRALQSQIGQIRAAGNVTQAGPSAGLIGDAIGSSLQARANLERDIALGGLQDAAELTTRREATRQQGQTRKEDLQTSGRQEEQALRTRLENIQQAIQDDTLRRQLINLDNRSRELFGRLSTEQNVVSQGVAERSGIRQQVLAEASQAEATRAQRESERIQQIEASKPPPSAGGKVLCTELHRQGYLPTEIWEADEREAANFSRETIAGYHLLAKPVVKLMQKSNVVTQILRPFISGWATEMAYRQGVAKKGSWIGRMLERFAAPLCAWIGKKITNYSLVKREAL